MNVKRVLVADDEELSRELLTHLLSPQYDVVAVENGEQTIKAVASEPPSLVLLDIQMPGIDGYETCRRLKQDARTSDCPVIFVSAKHEDKEILKGYEVGAADYLVKPIKPDELRFKVQQNIEYDEKRQALESRLTEANKMAFQALTDTSAYGAINLFLISALKCDSFDALAALLFETTSSWGLNCSLQIQVPDETLNFSDVGQVSPIEERVLSATIDRGRIHDFGARSVFADRHCSLLIKNMPIDDEVRYGNYKDYIARLIEGIEGRVCALLAEQTVRHRTEQLRKVLEFLLQTFRNIQTQNSQLRVGSATIVEQMLEDLNLTIDELGVVNDISEDSEARLLNVGEVCLNRTNALFSKGLKFNEQVESLISLFEQTLMREQITDQELATLIDSLAIPEVAG